MAVMCAKITNHTPGQYHIPIVSISNNEEGISCMQCTFINAFGAKTCSMCFAALPRKQKTVHKPDVEESTDKKIKSTTSDTSEANADSVATDASSKPTPTTTTKVPTKKAWGGWGKPSKPVKVESLQDIMKEQRVTRTTKASKATEPQKNDKPQNSNVAAAPMVSGTTDPTAGASAVTGSVETDNNTDADFALALKMQEEWAAEDQRQQRQPRSQPSTKVRLSTQRMGAAPYSEEALGHISSQVELEGAGEWEPEFSEDQRFITKHDPVLTGMKNTKRLAKQFNLRGLVEDRVLLNGRVANQLARHLKKKIAKGEAKHGRRAQEDFATRGEALDQRTKLVLFKWQQEELLGNLHGCFRTGKEAQLYQANLPDGQEAAVKVFQTTVTKFKNRAEYIQNDHRFVSKLGSNTKNRRKLVQVWTEKEFKNLNRLHRDGVPCPKPFFFRQHLLCMEFIGSNGHAAPQLREVSLSKKKVRRAYEQVVVAMWRMFNRCRLVHADLSEYNMLWHRNRVVVIDLGQAVNSTHPQALKYLQRDCKIVTRFFQCKGLSKSRLMSPQSLFDLVCTTEQQLRDMHTTPAPAPASAPALTPAPAPASAPALTPAPTTTPTPTPTSASASAPTPTPAPAPASATASASAASTTPDDEEDLGVHEPSPDEEDLGVDELVIMHWRAMATGGQHRNPDRSLVEGTKRAGWKSEYQGRMKSSLVSSYEALEDMTSAQFESLGHTTHTATDEDDTSTNV